jgi:hypothetical protein
VDAVDAGTILGTSAGQRRGDLGPARAGPRVSVAARESNDLLAALAAQYLTRQKSAPTVPFVTDRTAAQAIRLAEQR